MPRFLVPANGRRVLDPQTGRPLPAAGAWVEQSSYWVRRVAEGDVVDKTPQQSSSPVAAPARAPKKAQATRQERRG